MATTWLVTTATRGDDRRWYVSERDLEKQLVALASRLGASRVIVEPEQAMVPRVFRVYRANEYRRFDLDPKPVLVAELCES